MPKQCCNEQLILDDPYKALVIGSTGSIGKAFFEFFTNHSSCVHVEAVSRGDSMGFDLTDEASILSSALSVRDAGPFNIIIDATGALTLDGIGPEKSLSTLNSAQLLRYFHVNTVGPALVLKHFSTLLSDGASVYAKLSARVGSISDNRKGGWYGYRASKAALNMVLQTTAIELQRRHPRLRVVALQPGTVKSKLSGPFTASLQNVLTPQDSVQGMMECLLRLDAKTGAHFLDYKGQSIAW